MAEEKKTAEGSVHGAVSGRKVKKADRLFLVSGNNKRSEKSEFSSCFFQKLAKFIDHN